MTDDPKRTALFGPVKLVPATMIASDQGLHGFLLLRGESDEASPAYDFIGCSDPDLANWLRDALCGARRHKPVGADEVRRFAAVDSLLAVAGERWPAFGEQVQRA